MRPASLTFVAEFDLAALDPAIWPGPTTGTLSFFADVDAEALFIDSGGAALVLYHAAGTELQPLEFPDDLDPELRYTELVVSTRLAPTLPPRDDPYERMEAYNALRNKLLGLPSHWGPEHQLLGYHRGEQIGWSAINAEAVADGLSDEDPPATDWRALLQVSSDYDAIGAQFGDGGDLFFAIPDADLRAGRFERVQALTDSM